MGVVRGVIKEKRQEVELIRERVGGIRDYLLRGAPTLRLFPVMPLVLLNE